MVEAWYTYNTHLVYHSLHKLRRLFLCQKMQAD